MTDKLYTILKEIGNTKRVLSHSVEPFLRGVIELTRNGYELREGEVFASMAGYQAYFDEPKEVKITTQDVPPEPEQVSDPTPAKIEGVINTATDGTVSDRINLDSAKALTKLDLDKIKGMGKDRTALDKYGEELGVKLNRSKTFKNMLIDLEKAIGG